MQGLCLTCGKIEEATGRYGSRPACRTPQKERRNMNQRQREVIGSVKCPVCGAQAGEPCRSMSARRPGEPQSWEHRGRAQALNMANRIAKNTAAHR